MSGWNGHYNDAPEKALFLFLDALSAYRFFTALKLGRKEAGRGDKRAPLAVAVGCMSRVMDRATGGRPVVGAST